jgi:ketosteroid isomerase-like protein
MAVDHQAFFSRLVEAMERVDSSLWDEFFTEDAVQEYPQSGEIIRGRENGRQVLMNYPGGLQGGRIDSAASRVEAATEEWVMTPLFTLARVEGSGTRGTAVIKNQYPDGSDWWMIIFYQLRDGRIAHTQQYFAPVFEPPAWRSQWVEVRKED